MFIVQGLTLLVLDKPGGAVAARLSEALVNDAIPGKLPMPLVVLGILVVLWLWLKNTRFGTAIYAIGSDVDAARAQGISVAWTQFLVYVLAGGCYGFAGVFISAQTGAGDPLIGNAMLLQMFAAVVVGGTRLGGGRGGPIGSIIGAYILMIVVNHPARVQRLGLLLDHRRGRVSSSSRCLPGRCRDHRAPASTAA